MTYGGTGSRKWMVYEADDGTLFGSKIDESNGESCGYADVTAANQGDLKTVPKGFQERYLNCVLVQDGELIRRQFKIGTLAAYQAAIGARSLTVGGATWNVASYRGERGPLPFAFDTGRVDGDDT